MSISNITRKTFVYFLEATLEVFSPNHDNYPSIGIQPFEGEISDRDRF